MKIPHRPLRSLPSEGAGPSVGAALPA